MKQLVITTVEIGNKLQVTALMSDDERGGSAVPAFGMMGLRGALLWLEELTERALAGKLELVHMMNDGRTMDELKAAYASANEVKLAEARAAAPPARAVILSDHCHLSTNEPAHNRGEDANCVFCQSFNAKRGIG